MRKSETEHERTIMLRSREETLGFGLTYEKGSVDYEALLEYANL